MRKSRPHAQQGFALFLGLIFLLMITLVAVTAMRGTSLELAMANNTALREEAFEGAESARMALIRSLLPMMSCGRWPQGARLTSDNSAACLSLSCSTNNEFPNTANYPWETRLTVDSPPRLLSEAMPSQDINNPKTYVPRFTLKFGTGLAGIAAVGAAQLPVGLPPGSGAAMSLGYEGLGSGSARYNGVIYFDLTATATHQGAQPSVGGHFRAMTRDIHFDNCETDLVYGS